MKKVIRVFCFALLLVGVGFSTYFTAHQTVRAEDTPTESAYAQVWMNDMGGFSHSGATYDPITNSVTNLVSGGRFGYNSGFENVEVSSTINFSAISGGNVNFYLRMQGDLPNANYTRLGYQFRWYSHGQFEFLKNGATIIGPAWGPLPAPNTATTYTVIFSAINMSDGSVKVKAVVNGLTFIDYTDVSDVIIGTGMFAVTTDGFTLSATGNGFTSESICLYDMATPVTNANFPGTVINQDGSVDLVSGSVATGAAWAFQQTDFYSYKFNFTPSTTSGKLRLTIGSQGSLHRDDILGSGAWSETGYVLQWWGDNGQRHLFRNNTQLSYVWNLPTFEKDRTYEIEYGVTPFGDGSNRVHMRIDGALVVIYFDRPSDTYTPLTFAKSGTPGALLRYNLISGIGVDGKISPSTSTVQYDEKTLLTRDLGSPATHSAATFDRNGGITAMSSGRNAGYNGNFKNTVIKFDGNFTAVGSMILQLRGQSSEFDTPWGASWTNKGYMVYLYSNGQTILTKNGHKLCEGWSLSSRSIATNMDYTIEFGTVNVTKNAVRVFANINGSPVINYLDTSNALNNEGWFTIFNNSGFAGSLMPHGVEYPQITTNIASEDKALTNNPVTLGYSLAGESQSDKVTYYIDEANSTAQATISDNQLVATTVGDVVVYACVNGVYSNDVVIKVVEPATPELTGVPSIITFGQSNVTIDAKMSDDSEIVSKVFGVTNVSGEAIIDENTGEITPVKAGTIKVFAIVNDVKTEEITIIIIPVITITTPVSVIKGQNITLEYTTNCDLPNEAISTSWEIVSGSDVATINESTGEVIPIKAGEFTVKVTLIAESFEVESDNLTLSVITPIITDLPVAPIIVGGETWSVDAKMSDDSEVVSKSFGITNISGHATINETTGAITPVKAGTIRVFAIVNGVKTDEHIIVIIPKVFIHKVGSFAFGGVYDLNLYYSANCDLPNEQITVTFEMVSGEEYATLDANTGILNVGNTPGIVGLKVYIIGETFQAVSAVTPISIEEPIIIVQDSFLGDLYVGQSITLVPSVSQGGIEVETASIVAVSGADCVTIQGLTITAIKPGTFKYKIVVNDILIDDDEGLEIAIEELIPTIIANEEMVANTTQQAGLMFNDNDYSYSNVVWSIVSGHEYITLSDTGLVTSVRSGKAIIKAVVDGIFETTLEITIHGDVVLYGVSQDADVLVGGSIQLSYRVNEEVVGKIETVEYIVVGGRDCVTITQDGKLEATKTGTVRIKVVVNGIESQEIAFNVFKNDPSGVPKNNTILWIIVGSCCGGLLVVCGIVVGVVLATKQTKLKRDALQVQAEDANIEVNGNGGNNFITMDNAKNKKTKANNKKKSKNGKK